MFVDGAGELMFLPGRMSAQVPFNMLITGAMVTFYKGAAIYKHYTGPGSTTLHYGYRYIFLFC